MNKGSANVIGVKKDSARAHPVYLVTFEIAGDRIPTQQIHVEVDATNVRDVGAAERAGRTILEKFCREVAPPKAAVPPGPLRMRPSAPDDESSG